jgi:hypothetical protein
MDERLKGAIRDIATEALLIIVEKTHESQSVAITAVKDELKFFIAHPEEVSPNLLAHARELLESN